MPFARGATVHVGLGNPGQLLVGGLFFAERLAEQPGDGALSEHLCIGAYRAIRRDLVVLHFLRRRNQHRVQERPRVGRAHQLLPFFDQTFHRFARLARRIFFEHLQRTLRPLHVPSGFGEVTPERRLQLAAGSALGHQRQRFEQLFLGVHQISKFFDKMFTQRSH